MAVNNLSCYISLLGYSGRSNWLKLFTHTLVNNNNNMLTMYVPKEVS